MHPETIIIVGAGRLQVPAIREARTLGYRVAAVDGSPDAPGLALADFPVAVSYPVIEAVIEELKKLPAHSFRAVMTAGTDATLTVAAVAREFSLPGLSLETAEILSNKRRMRELLASHGFRSPHFTALRNVDDTSRAAAKLGFPLVVKPVDNMGGRGVILVCSMTELARAAREAMSLSRTGEILLEEFMTGPELSADVLVDDGRAYLLPPADRWIVNGPRFIETGHALPSRLDGKIIRRVRDVSQRLAAALEMDRGVIKLDLLIDDGEPVVVEMAGRLSGGRNSAVTIPLHSGLNATSLALRLALGEPLSDRDLEPTRNRGVVKRILLPPPGRVTAVEGIDDVRRWPGVYDVYTGIGVGDTVPEVRSNVDRVFHVITEADTRDEAEEIAEKAVQTIKITTVA